MRVSTEDIASALRDLLSGARSREEIASWASSVRAANDAEEIQYFPPTAEAAIWEALEFLMGVDLKDGPDSYLHNQRDFEEFWAAKKSALLG